ncbi:MAG: 1-acyl-sn-glycerol-3-phosphate acyltransferase [Chloroflexi bacterium]|nr:1-acyl-sn-glycerol-3-phosphate acyltransferase [Chloroflexota bacterium]
MSFRKAWYLIGRFLVSLYVKFYLEANIHYETPLPKGAKILALNHPSTSDPFFATVLVKEYAATLIHGPIFKMPVVGQSLRLSGQIPVIAGNGKAALEEGIRRLRAGETIIIFPEGSISPLEGGLQKARSGMARLALATGAPVIPVGISLDPDRIRLVETNVGGNQEISTWYFRGPYAMTTGQPMTFQGSADDWELVTGVTRMVMERITDLKHRSELRLKAQQFAEEKAARLGFFHWVSGWASRSVGARTFQTGLVLLMLVGRHL